MTQSTYDQIQGRLLARCQAIQGLKRREYTEGSRDVLANFKQVANVSQASPGVVWNVYFEKQASTVRTLMREAFEGGPLRASEPPLDRFADAINYLILGAALFFERTNDDDEALALAATAPGATHVKDDPQVGDAAVN